MSGIADLPKDRRGRPDRIGNLADAICSNHPDLNRARLKTDLKDALAWSSKRFHLRRIPTIKDELSDPFVMPEKLLAVARADRETILASILYPALRPAQSNRIDTPGLKEIEDRFGKRILNLVKYTLQLQALDYLQPASTSRHYRAKHLSLFRLMALWTALDPRAILIRSTQALVNLERFRTHGTRQEKQNLIWLANNIAAPLAYVVGYAKLGQSVLDRSFFLENPAEYASVERTLDKSSLKDPAIAGEIRETVAKLVESHGISRKYFEIEVNSKSPASAHAKALQKKQTVEQLGDKARFRIIFKSSLHERTGEDLGDICREVYAALRDEFGRGSQDDKIREHFRRIVKLDPDRDDPIKDDRFDDYISKPKASGYSAIQDTFFLRIGGELVEFEGQIVDEKRHEVNTYGPRAGHVFYKAGFQKLSHVLKSWYQAGQAVLEDRAPKTKYVYAYGPGHEIMGDIEGRLTPKAFAQGRAVRNALVDNDDPFARRNPNVPVSPFLPLLNGDRVVSLECA